MVTNKRTETRPRGKVLIFFCFIPVSLVFHARETGRMSVFPRLNTNCMFLLRYWLIVLLAFVLNGLWLVSCNRLWWLVWVLFSLSRCFCVIFVFFTSWIKYYVMSLTTFTRNPIRKPLYLLQQEVKRSWIFIGSFVYISGSTCSWVWTHFGQSAGEDAWNSPWLHWAWQGGL